MCCRHKTENPESPAKEYGSFGKMGCNLPTKTFELMIDKINELKPDIVFWTGDFIPHEVWVGVSLEHIKVYQEYLAN